LLSKFPARRPQAATTISVVALVFATTGFAVGSIPGRGGTISVCYPKNGGGLRVIDSAKRGVAGKCGKKEKALSWNQQGLQGLRGAQGLQGIQGVPGGQGIQGIPGTPGGPGPTFGATAMGGAFSDPPTSPDESSTNATDSGRHFDFTLPAGGNVYVRFFTPFIGRACTPPGVAQAGLYLDGAPVANTAQSVANASSPLVAELVSVAAAAGGPHSFEVREDCPSGALSGASESGHTSWTVLLLGS
jgi:hypothetical protein